MMEWLDGLVFVGLLGSGLVAGVFYAFSTFIMKALGRLPANQGIAAMNEINLAVLNPWFFVAFFGTAGVCVPVAILASRMAIGNGLVLFGGCALYSIGCVLVTMVFNVPLNNRLAKVDPDGGDGKALWAHYLSRWTRWNHVRTAASLVAAGLFAVGLAQGFAE